MSIWPFKYVNGVQTPESVQLEALPVPKPLTPYQQCLETQPEEALI